MMSRNFCVACKPLAKYILETFEALLNKNARLGILSIIYHYEVAKITSGSKSDDDASSESIGSMVDDTASDIDELDTYMGFTKRIVGLLGRISRISQSEYCPATTLEAHLM